jgi:hypothetical protein
MMLVDAGLVALMTMLIASTFFTLYRLADSRGRLSKEWYHSYVTVSPMTVVEMAYIQPADITDLNVYPSLSRYLVST